MRKLDDRTFEDLYKSEKDKVKKLQKERAAIDEIYDLFLNDFNDEKNHSAQVLKIVSKVRKNRDK